MNYITELLPIISLGYIINCGLFLLNFVKAILLIKNSLKFFTLNLDSIKKLADIQKRNTSWVNQHRGFISLLFPFAYALVLARDLYLTHKLNYNVIHMYIYLIEKEMSTGHKLSTYDFETFSKIKEQFNYKGL